MKSRAISLVSLLIGIGLFYYLISQTGMAEVIARVRAMGVGFLLLLGISSLRHLARTYAWLRCMSDDDRSLGFWTVLRARLAGDAMADLTAGGPFVGEPIKLAQLQGQRRLTSLASSLAVENLAYAVSSGLLVVSGTFTLLTFFVVSDSLRRVSLLGVLLVVVILLWIVFVIGRRWMIVSKTVELLFRLFRRDFAKLERVRELERYVFDFYAQRRRDFFIVACCEFVFHLSGVLEIYATLQLIGFPSAMLIAFILEAVNRVINVVFAFVPGLVGVDEAGTGLLTLTLGLGATAGVTLAVVRKARMLVWIGLGLVCLVRKSK